MNNESRLHAFYTRSAPRQGASWLELLEFEGYNQKCEPRDPDHDSGSCRTAKNFSRFYPQRHLFQDLAMNTLSITKRLWILICCAVVALLAVGFVGINAAHIAQDGIRNIREDSLVGISLLAAINNNYQRIRVNAYAHAASVNETEMAGIEQRIQEFENSIKADFKRYEATLNSDEDRAMLEADRKGIANYLELFRSKVQPISRKGDTPAALALLRNELRPAAQATSDAIDKHIDYNEKSANDYASKVTESVSRATQIAIVAILAAALAIGLMGYFMISGVQKSLIQIQDSVGRTERDLDFTLRTPILRQDEIGTTARGLNRLIDTLQANLQGIQTRAVTVAQSATAMSTTSGQVATAAHQQSEAAAHMAATVEEMTVSITHVGDRAHEADRISTASGQLAASGETVIARTVADINTIASTVNLAAERIRGLEAHSQQIASVVAVIKEVADQTNLLALNAAIEAARAGEQGRGFAVVADEVRKLAERTATSTQEIAATIEAMRGSASEAAAGMGNVVAEVGRGVDSAREASEAIRQIGEGSREAVTIVAEITAAIHEQASAMTSIAQQVERIAQMSEESSAAAGNSAQIAKDLDTLASEVQQIVGAYRL